MKSKHVNKQINITNHEKNLNKLDQQKIPTCGEEESDLLISKQSQANHLKRDGRRQPIQTTKT